MASPNSSPPHLAEQDIAKAMNNLIKNLQPVLHSIKFTLGGDWTFYEECIREIILGIADQNSISVWIEQMQTLVDDTPAISSDHIGVVFLFGNMGIDISSVAAKTLAAVTSEDLRDVNSELRPAERPENYGDEVEEALRVIERKAVEAAVRDIQEQEVDLEGYKFEKRVKGGSRASGSGTKGRAVHPGSN